VPAGGADDHGLAGMYASFGIRDNSRGRGEVNDGVEGGEKISREGAGVRVFCATQRLHVMTSFARHVSDERTGFATAEDQEIHRNHLTAEYAALAEKV
jgi:hypothetical protein